MLLIYLCAPAYAENSEIEQVKNLSLSNPVIKSLRKDVMKTLFVVKGRRPAGEIPELRFYSYKLKRSETFWTVLARTSLDIDTLMTINNLSSPQAVKPGCTIYLTNMRGILRKRKSDADLLMLLTRQRILKKYVEKINGKLERNYLFIPCGEVSKLERSLFMGTGFILPVRGSHMTSGFGTRVNPFEPTQHEFHPGIDLSCRTGTPVQAARTGTVVFTGYKGGYGKLVVLRHECGYTSYYGHLSKILVKRGQKVSCGSRIALSGNTGRTTGPHLHFEVRKNSRPINPGLLIHE